MQHDELDDNCCMHSQNAVGIEGESLYVSLKGGCKSEIKADLMVKEVQTVRIWGQIKNCKGHPVPKVLLKLLRCCRGNLSGIAHTISDCQGFYQFDLCDKSAPGEYLILAGKPAYGMERVLDAAHSNCNDYPPCEVDTSEVGSAASTDCSCHSACKHCTKSVFCKSCAYYDEESETCCFGHDA